MAEGIFLSWEEKEGRALRKALIVRGEVMFDNIRIKCPISQTEHEVSKDAKEILCPVDSTVLVIF